jgi:hypothetical protein
MAEEVIGKLTAISRYVLLPLRLADVVSLGDNTMFTYPYNCIEFLVNEATKMFSHDQVWQVTKTDDTLLYDTTCLNEYNLADYEIDPKSIEQISFMSGTQVRYVTRMGYTSFKRLYKGITVTGYPLSFSIKGNKLLFYPLHDMDYQLKVTHYKRLSYVDKDTDIIELIPNKYLNALYSYVSIILAGIMKKDNFNAINDKHSDLMIQASLDNQLSFSNVDYMPSALTFGGFDDCYY